GWTSNEARATSSRGPQCLRYHRRGDAPVAHGSDSHAGGLLSWRRAFRAWRAVFLGGYEPQPVGAAAYRGRLVWTGPAFFLDEILPVAFRAPRARASRSRDLSCVGVAPWPADFFHAGNHPIDRAVSAAAGIFPDPAVSLGLRLLPECH